jgi:GNAT superfamily N-acetyltransferase
MLRNEHWKSLKEGFTVRPPRMEDLESVVEMLNISSMDLIGVEDFSDNEIRLDWQTPGFSLEDDTRAVFNAEGELVRPDHENLGIGTGMLGWAIDRAKDAITRVPENARVAVNSYAIAGHGPSKKLLENNGLKLFRHSWQMSIDLMDDIPEPVWPDGIVLQAYEHEKHGAAVYRADYEAFQDHFGFVEEPFDVGYPKWVHHMLQDEHYDPQLWFLAFDGDEVAGGSICRAVSWEDPDSGWVRTLFVRRPWRRRGLALALLHHTFHHFRAMGRKRVGLGVDAENLTGATGLYKKAGMRIKRQYDRYELELRSGVELSNNGNNS